MNDGNPPPPWTIKAEPPILFQEGKVDLEVPDTALVKVRIDNDEFLQAHCLERFKVHAALLCNILLPQDRVFM